MRKLYFLTWSVFISGTITSQGGVGINNSGGAPNSSTMLDVSSDSKGVLIPRVSLTSTTDATTITNGNIVSLLVYNTSTIADIIPGYYYWDGTVWKTMGGGDDADADPNNEIQDLQLVGNDLTITNNGTPTTIDLSPYLDNTDDQNIDSVSLNGASLTVFIEDGTSSSVDLSSLLDHDWYEVGGTTAPDNINDNIYTQGNVGIGIINPLNRLHLLDGGGIRQSVSTDVSHSIKMFNDISNRNWQLYHLGSTDASAPNGFMLEYYDGTAWNRRMTINQIGNVGIGIPNPSYKTHISGAGPTELMIEGTSSGYINAALALKANTDSDYRGSGVFMYDFGGQNEWYAGRPYAGSDTYVVQRNTSLTDHNTVTAALSDGSGNPTTTERFFAIDNEGDALVNGSVPDPSAKLEVRSANKGFLPPQVSLTGNNDLITVASPANGLLIYNTATAGTGVNSIEPGHYYFNGTKWKPIGETSDWYLDNTNSFTGGLPLISNPSASTIGNPLYTNYVNLQKGVYHVSFYDCLSAGSLNYYVQTTVESSSPTDLVAGFMNYNFNERTDFSHAGFIFYVRKNGTPVRFLVRNPSDTNATLTIPQTSNSCSAFYYSKISE